MQETSLHEFLVLVDFMFIWNMCCIFYHMWHLPSNGISVLTSPMSTSMIVLSLILLLLVIWNLIFHAVCMLSLQGPTQVQWALITSSGWRPVDSNSSFSSLPLILCLDIIFPHGFWIYLKAFNKFYFYDLHTSKVNVHLDIENQRILILGILITKTTR